MLQSFETQACDKELLLQPCSGRFAPREASRIRCCVSVTFVTFLEGSQRSFSRAEGVAAALMSMQIKFLWALERPENEAVFLPRRGGFMQVRAGAFPFHSPSFSISFGARGRGENLAKAEFGDNAIRGRSFT
ncbi:hypothetical protein [Ensifer adhaerens]|uniref:hypothetical protein n=1 Tax=Ensifer adhaerens TaxID=106592 RepID=UPI000B338C7D|nr:hypothetical protein [Ensifer adhaerens]